MLDGNVKAVYESVVGGWRASLPSCGRLQKSLRPSEEGRVCSFAYDDDAFMIEVL